MARKSSHKWTFRPGMRAGAFGWRGSAKAVDRLNQAKSEIRADPVTAAEGVVVLAERIWPAFEHIDTSSGALGGAVRRTLECGEARNKDQRDAVGGRRTGRRA